MSALSEVFDNGIAEHLSVVQAITESRALLERIAVQMSTALQKGKKIFWCGNGGSAADSQHLAAEMVGRFLMERRALPSIALTANTSVLTAIGNDYGYEHVFERQVEALCAPGDVLVGISTSGNSANVCCALEQARSMGAFTVAMTGKSGGRASGIAHETLRMPSAETPRIQEGHILCGHMLCDYIERYLFQSEKGESNLTAAVPVKE